MTDSPVAYIAFNRPQHTEKTFAVLREQRPSQLFIIADGPRPGHPTDAERCAAVREIVEQVDWPCEVHRHYADSNMGLKQRVSSGLDWVFSQVERAIVLEDDCVAHPDFFRFCDALLDKYADDDRVSVITGNNFQNGHWRGDGSYYFSKYNHCWGWATWRREWLKYEGSIPFWDKWKVSEDWAQKTPDRVERRYWGRIFDGVRAGKFDSWAYPWTASLWYRGGLTATPNVNLVSNIGFGKESTHTGSRSSPVAELPTSEIGTLSHPSEVGQDLVADQHVFEFNFGGRNQRFPKNLIIIPRRLARWCFLRLKLS
ncbi:hemolytic protein HlpA-like protein [Thioalkalivibrio versutus]|uniref:hemolytic protein HlpA-like protein n=1 Tax=Thioalkalivibrio versutus TaxID=106634 RepID=UPI0009863852|nr:hemolytic protein HlpA-like protein [Thioalkalivibrio versutus]OOC47844.1 hemolytic protein HlpA-like protein [Thioalkalivibrio versutus]